MLSQRKGLTTDIDNTVFVANEVFTLTSLQSIFDDIKQSPSLLLISLDSVWDLLRCVTAVDQRMGDNRLEGEGCLQEVVGLTLHGSDTWVLAARSIVYMKLVDQQTDLHDQRRSKKSPCSSK